MAAIAGNPVRLLCGNISSVFWVHWTFRPVGAPPHKDIFLTSGNVSLDDNSMFSNPLVFVRNVTKMADAGTYVCRKHSYGRNQHITSTIYRIQLFVLGMPITMFLIFHHVLKPCFFSSHYIQAMPVYYWELWLAYLRHNSNYLFFRTKQINSTFNFKA